MVEKSTGESALAGARQQKSRVVPGLDAIRVAGTGLVAAVSARVAPAKAVGGVVIRA